MQAGKIYSVNENRLKYAFKKNIIQERETLQFHGSGCCYFMALDSGESQGLWGKVHLSCDNMKSAYVTVRVRVSDDKYIETLKSSVLLDDYLSDERISIEDKKRLFTDEKCICAENMDDILLYKMKGRYLWIQIDVKCEKKVNGTIRNIKVFQNEDNLLSIFPEIYRERNSFFHRYLTIYSDLYYGMQKKIEDFPKIFDVNNTPAELLPILIGWLGIDVRGEFMKEEQLRQLTKEAYTLNKGKGTKKTLKRVAEIVLDEKVEIKEKGIDTNEYSSDITVLINTKISQSRKAGVIYLLRQFKPIRSTMKVVFLDKIGQSEDDFVIDSSTSITDGKSSQLDAYQNYENIIIN